MHTLTNGLTTYQTLQTIAFNAHLRELGHFRPFLIVCPLSVLHNWIEEFHRFAPAVCHSFSSFLHFIHDIIQQIPVCMYHGSPTERAELRRTAMRQPDDGSETAARPFESVMVKEPQQQKKKGRRSTTVSRNTARKRKVESDDDNDEESEKKEKDTPRKRYTHSSLQTRETFPVVVTTYEMIIRDQLHLSKYNWGYIVVDEGHRLKNLNCRLVQEIKRYTSAGRMILTGTPLHVSSGSCGVAALIHCR